MKRSTIILGAAGAALGCAVLMSGGVARSEAAAVDGKGTAAIYGNIAPDQIEFLSTPERIKSIAATGTPLAVWETLEHGERVECLDCIPVVAPLLYNENARTREISAWWLRRRILGVFGPGEVYEQTINALNGDADPKKRAYAASALGEFLVAPGVEACATALAKDADPTVRAAAASALGRLNSDGNGALGRALSDGDAEVKLAAITSAGRITTFADVASVAKLTGDADARVRRRGLELLDTMRAKDAVASAMALAKNDPDADVRLAACHALGSFQDASARAVLENIAQTDTSGLVRDQAQIALRRL